MLISSSAGERELRLGPVQISSLSLAAIYGGFFLASLMHSQLSMGTVFSTVLWYIVIKFLRYYSKDPFFLAFFIRYFIVCLYNCSISNQVIAVAFRDQYEP